MSTQVEDRRGQSPLAGRGAGIGCGGLVMLLLLAWLTGTNPLQLLDAVGGGGGAPLPAPAPSSTGGAPQDELGQFAGVVLASTEDTWNQIFAQQGSRYQLPTLVLFNDRVTSACGFQSAAVGPFYCPPDQKIYIDLSFFDQLARRFGAPGDFGQAYVLAHEVGHHVQNLLGISTQVHQQKQRVSRTEANRLSVALELQADCLAGVWGYHAARQGLIEAGDFEEGLRAAGAIGDDQMQRRAGQYVRPESFTHGSSAQRQEWLRRGLSTGDPNACETFR